MAAILRGALGANETPAWLPWVVLGTALLYFVGYVDGSVHGAILGDAGLKLNYVHEFFHHARHIAMMCH